MSWNLTKFIPSLLFLSSLQSFDWIKKSQKFCIFFLHLPNFQAPISPLNFFHLLSQEDNLMLPRKDKFNIATMGIRKITTLNTFLHPSLIVVIPRKIFNTALARLDKNSPAQPQKYWEMIRGKCSTSPKPFVNLLSSTS